MCWSTGTASPYRRPVDDFSEITDERWRRTFAVNVDSFFHVTYAKIVLISHELSSQLVSGDQRREFLAACGTGLRHRPVYVALHRACRERQALGNGGARQSLAQQAPPRSRIRDRSAATAGWLDEARG